MFTMLQKYLMIPGRNCIFLCKVFAVGPDGHDLPILMTMLLNEIKKTKKLRCLEKIKMSKEKTTRVGKTRKDIFVLLE
jgi:hypothetical protein